MNDLKIKQRNLDLIQKSRRWQSNKLKIYMIPLLKSFRKYLQVGNINEWRHKQIKFLIRSSIFEANGTNISCQLSRLHKSFCPLSKESSPNESFPQNKSYVENSWRQRLFSASTLFRLSTHLGTPYRQESEKYLLLEKVPSPGSKAENKPEFLQREETSDFLRQTNRIGTILSFLSLC